jgi:type I restriction-modification system DNA methylase subunit
MNTITNNVMAMQNELRNKEGITGIDAMHHVLMVLLAKSFTIVQCRKLNIPEEYAFENMIGLNKTELYNKFYNPRNSQNCVVRYIRLGGVFGYTKDLPFQIKNESTLEFMYHRINNISTEELMNTHDVIGDIYEHFINREGKTMKDLGQYFTDRGLIKYLVRLCNPQSINGNVPTIWDPASGTGGFLIEYIRQLTEANPGINWSLNKSNLFANDINKNTYSLLKQNLYYSLKEGSGITIKLLDSLVSNDDQMFDFILANPPFGIKGLKYKDMNDQIKSLGINGTKGEILFLQLCMCKLNENGKCCIVVPEGVLFNSTKMYKETRKHLLKNFNLKKIIKVGEGEFFKNTGVKTSVLFFEKNGKTENVEFIQVNKVNDTIEEVPLMTVEMEKIIVNDYSLNMNLYKEIVLDVNEDYEVVELGNISEYINYETSKKVDDGQLPFYTCSPKITKCNNISLPRDKYILIGTRGTISKGVHYVDNLDIGMGNNLFAIKINCQVNTKYIYYFIKINSHLIESLITGSTIPMISKTTLSKLKIILPPLEVQNRIVEQLDNIYETEIESSKKVVESLKMSIETIMKNTMYRDDLQEYKIKDICDFVRGKIQTSKIDKIENGLYPIISKAKDKKSWKYINEYHMDGEYIILASEFAGNGENPLPIHYYSGKFNLSCLAIALEINEKINKKYLYNILNVNIDLFNKYFQSGSCKKKVDTEIFKNYKIRIPPIEIQKQTLEKIEPKESLIQELEKNIERAELEAKDIMSVLFN